MAASVHWEGQGEFLRALQQADGLAMKALVAGMLAEQGRTITVAKARTPVDTGTLRASGTVLPPKVAGTRVEVQAGFGGAASGYAIFVHEKLGPHHPVGQAKFLESAFLERAPQMPKNLAREIEQAWRRLAS